MMSRRRSGISLLVVILFVSFSLLASSSFPSFLAPLPSLSSHSSHHHHHHQSHSRFSFRIADDRFWKDDRPFQIVGGDIHYFRILPQYWEDRLLRAKALGLNTIQTYVPWNLHEPLPQKWVFEGIADVQAFLKLAHNLGFLVMLRAGPYICGEWDLGGFPAWLLAVEPPLRLRSSDHAFLHLVERWWGVLLPKIAPLLYENGGPIIMVQVENEFGSYGDDKAYLRQLAALARKHLGDETILYTTDGGTRDTLNKGTIPEEGVYAALRRVIKKYSGVSLPQFPSNNNGARYGLVKFSRSASFFDVLDTLCDPVEVVKTEEPMTMESVGQMFGILLYVSEYTAKATGNILSIPQVHDRAQVFVSCALDDDGGSPRYVGSIERWSNRALEISNVKCSSNISLFILVENMGRVNYGPYIYDTKGILSSVTVDGIILRPWKMYPITFSKLSNLFKDNTIMQVADSRNDITFRRHASKDFISQEPRFYEGRLFIDSQDQIKDTFISFRGWNKGVAFVNNFNIGRFWPIAGPQCNLYVPAPILQRGENVVVMLELHTPKPDLTINFVEHPDFTCGSRSS